VADGHNTVRKLALILEREERLSKRQTESFLEVNRKKAKTVLVDYPISDEEF
jgi:hypothetical protein